MMIHRIGFKVALFAFLLLVSPQWSLANIDSNATEKEVRAYFADIPVLIAIAHCESRFRQFDAEGLPLRGGQGGGMIGVFQFYEAIHKGTAQALGFDIATLEGNLGYARHLHAQSGTLPWNGARKCWGNATLLPAQSDDSHIQSLQAQVDALMKIVAQLEVLLEQKKLASAL